MKRFLTLILLILTMILFTACGETNNSDKTATKIESAQSQPVEQKNEPIPTQNSGKILVAYFSRAGDNYRKLAVKAPSFSYGDEAAPKIY